MAHAALAAHRSQASGTGRRARVRRQWERRLARFKESGLSQARFCSRYGLAPSAFQYWKHRLEKAAGTRSGAKPPAPRSAVSGAMKTPACLPQRGQADRSPAGRSVPFLPVRVVAGAPAGAAILPELRSSVVEVVLRSGRVLRAAADLDPHALARLADALEGRPC
ncbi:hypothetical protein [Tepidiforma sp.]|uniref:IS66 family insertion sequence element accessory protein TnpA n=1 Tax=Tepidiforma sp. TaxID=2682230 RepID=UPI0026203518|nr:hypothetical protein [Tepidiforma sp.]MCX7619088.1 hypothetical protein [Tepidiforma sp.]